MKRKRKGRSPVGQKVSKKASVLPGWSPYALFAILALVMFREFVVSNGLLFGTDVLALGFYARHFYAEMVRSGTFPLWNPHIFGGLPFVDAMHGDIFYPTTVLKFFIPTHRAMGWKIILHVFLAGVVTYGWLRHLGIGRLIATFGGVAYMLAPVLISLVYPGHDGKLFVTALTPLALWVTDWSITRGGIGRFAVLSIVVALLIFTAHMQLAYYTTWAMAVLVVYRLVRARNEGLSTPSLAGRFGAFALAGLVGALGIGAIQMWTPLRYLTKYSQRVDKSIEAEAESAYTRATSYSLHPEEAMSLVVPEFIGANLQTELGAVNTYWGRNLFKLNHEYAGLIPLVLVPVAFMLRRRRGEVWLFTGIAAASLIYALGATTPLFRLFYWLVPGVKLFRAPSSIMFVFAIAVITAAAIGLQELSARADEDDEEWGAISRRVGKYLWATAGVFLLLALMAAAGALTELWTATLYRGIAPGKAAALEANLENIQRGLWITVFTLAALAGAWQLRRQRHLSQNAWLGVVIALVVIDLWRVDAAFLRVINPGQIYPRDDTTQFLVRQQNSGEPFRIFPVPGAPYQPNHFAYHGLDELRGHHGNELGRYMEMVDDDRIVRADFRVLRILNVKYLVSPSPIQAPGLREVYRGGRSLVYELEGAHPRATLLTAVEPIPDSLALDRMLSSDFDPNVTALIDGDASVELGGGVASGSVRWTERGINRQVLEVETSARGVLLVADNYYPAWQATIDGEQTPILRADYSLRAVPVPAGNHTIVFEYRSSLFRAALMTTLISLLVIAATIGTSLVQMQRSRRELAEAGAA